MKKVLLVDIDDIVIGECEKQKAHESPKLHRAFSVFLYNGNKMLIQKRALKKYHSGNLLTNACCSHPQKDEQLLMCAKNRLKEELNINIDFLKEIGSFVYFNKFSEKLYEYELDHIIIGEYKGEFKVNLEEAEWADWFDIDFLKKDVVENPQNYTVWFLTAFPIVVSKMNKNFFDCQ